MVILDTNILIDAMHGSKKAIELIRTYESEQLAITVLNKYELLKGSKFIGKTVIEEYIGEMKIYYLEDKEIEVASGIYSALKENGTPIDELDILIAGIAISNNEHLVTFDKHFAKIKSDKILIV